MIKSLNLKTDEILPALSLVNSVVPSKSSLPILNDVRIETKDDGNGGAYVELTTSDTETWLQVKSTIESGEVGILFCVEAKGLLQALRNLSGQTVTMEIDTDKHNLLCTYTNGHFQMPIEEANEFPMPTVVDGDTIKKNVDKEKLLTSIEKAGFATANDELRPVMNGVRFEFFPDGMVSVASDGHKLVKYKDLTVTHNGTDPVLRGFTLPKKPSHVLLNVLANTIAGNVDICFNERAITFGNAMFNITTRVIEGRYPNYDSVIPKDNDKSVIVDKNAFICAIKRVLPMGNDSSELVCLTFENETLSISAEDIDFSKSAKENVACNYGRENPPLTIGFKGSALFQLLQNIEGDTAKIEFKEPSRAAIFTEEKPNGIYEYTSLLMPMLMSN